MMRENTIGKKKEKRCLRKSFENKMKWMRNKVDLKEMCFEHSRKHGEILVQRRNEVEEKKSFFLKRF